MPPFSGLDSLWPELGFFCLFFCFFLEKEKPKGKKKKREGSKHSSVAAPQGHSPTGPMGPTQPRAWALRSGAAQGPGFKCRATWGLRTVRFLSYCPHAVCRFPGPQEVGVGGPRAHPGKCLTVFWCFLISPSPIWAKGVLQGPLHLGVPVTLCPPAGYRAKPGLEPHGENFGPRDPNPQWPWAHSWRGRSSVCPAKPSLSLYFIFLIFVETLGKIGVQWGLFRILSGLSPAHGDP